LKYSTLDMPEITDGEVSERLMNMYIITGRRSNTINVVTINEIEPSVQLDTSPKPNEPWYRKQKRMRY
jgi:hypothetical protein